VVWEIHLYNMSEEQDTGTCSIIQAALYRNGFNAIGIDAPAACNITRNCPTAIRKTPVIVSKFGGAKMSLFSTTGLITACANSLFRIG
jgi:hypothetical protein